MIPLKRLLANFILFLKKKQLIDEKTIPTIPYHLPEPLHDGLLTNRSLRFESNFVQEFVHFLEPFVSKRFLAFSENGKYIVSVADADGRQIAKMELIYIYFSD